MKLIGDYSPSSVKDNGIKTYFGKAVSCMFCYHSQKSFFAGRKVAVDASMCLYQFLIAVRTSDGVLTSSDGEETRFVCKLLFSELVYCVHLQSSGGNVLSDYSYGGKWN